MAFASRNELFYAKYPSRTSQLRQRIRWFLVTRFNIQSDNLNR